MISCPACGQSCTTPPTNTITATEAAQAFVLKEEFPRQNHELMRLITELWRGNTCDIQQCQNCQLKFAWPFVAGSGVFYNLAYPYSDYPKQRWEWDQSVAALPGVDLQHGPVLEIGSGFGYFLQKISPSHLPADRVVAIEYNDFSRNRLKELGFAALGDDIRSPHFDSYHKQFSAVFMFQVLEHMDDIAGVVSRINHLCRPGASVFIAVPNHLRIDFNESHQSLIDMPPNHISRWTHAAFSHLGARVGWQMMDYRIEPMSWPAFIKQDLVYTHMRRAQRPGSLANVVRGRRRTRLRMILEGLAALSAAPLRIPSWLDAARSTGSLGGSSWVHFKTPSIR